MAHDVAIFSDVYSLCCGNRATTRRPLPIRRFTWERHYLADGTSERKDASISHCEQPHRQWWSWKAGFHHRRSESAPGARSIKAESADPDRRSRSTSDTEQTRLDSLGNVAKDPGALDKITTAIGSSFAALAKSHDVDGVDREQLVKEIMIAAQSLEGPVQKYPKTGRGILAAPQERYFVALPELSNSRSSGSDSESGSDSLLKTDIGTLSYWANHQEYLAQKQPKGVIPLRQIAQVNYSKDANDGCRVNLKHNCDQKGGDTCELQLKFQSKRAAEEWSYNLSQFLIKLRTLHGME